MKIFGKKDEKKTKKVSENVVRIEVLRLLGGTVPYTIAKFEATQERDSDNNLVLIESAYSFKDDVDIVQHKLIQDLDERLELHKKSIEERKEVVKKKIVEQQDLISKIKDGYIHKKVTENGKEVEKKIKINKIDEDKKLREYRILLTHLEENGAGSYETIDSDGLKRIMYLYKEGILIPYKFISVKNTLYPDISTKRKVYKENQDLIDQEFFNDNKGFFSGWKKWVAIGIMVIWLLSNIYYSVNLNRAYATFDENKAEEYSTKCAYWCSTIADETKNFIKTYDLMIKERELLEKEGSVSIG
jgi:hypothetical protein